MLAYNIVQLHVSHVHLSQRRRSPGELLWLPNELAGGSGPSNTSLYSGRGRFAP